MFFSNGFASLAMCVTPLVSTALAAPHQAQGAVKAMPRSDDLPVGHVYVMIDGQTSGCLTSDGTWDTDEDADCRDLNQISVGDEGAFKLSMDNPDDVGGMNTIYQIVQFGDGGEATFVVDENSYIVNNASDSADWYAECMPGDCESSAEGGGIYFSELTERDGIEFPFVAQLQFTIPE